MRGDKYKMETREYISWVLVALLAIVAVVLASTANWEETPVCDVCVCEGASESFCADFIEDCPVVEPVVCPEVNETLCVDFVETVEEDLAEEDAARETARDEIEAEMSDDDFVEDVFDFLVNDLGLDVNDEDDVSLEDADGFEWSYDWSDTEDGEGEVTVEFKAYYTEDGDDDDEKLECLFVLEDFEIDGYTLSEH